MVLASYRHWSWLISFLATLTVVAACLAAPRPTTSVRQPDIRYEMLVDVDFERAFLNVTQVVHVRNPSAVALTSLVFNVPPLAFNAFTLSSATVGDIIVSHSEDGVMLDVPLPRPLAPGDTATAVLRWWGQLPESNGRYGRANGDLILGNWYPMLAVLDNGQWKRHQYTSIGDAFYSDVADYDVVVSVPPTVTVAASGVLVGRKEGAWSFHAENARDFAMAISSRFQTQSRTVGGVTISAYYFPEMAERARLALDITEQAMRWYAQRIGPYPFPTLSIVEAPGSGVHVAQEHTALFFLRSDRFTPASVGIYVAHELAHAWFFAAVGNDQIREPWLDEGLVTAISLDFYREVYPKQYPDHWATWGISLEDMQKLPPMNRRITDFEPDGMYFRTVYQQGARFFKTVREVMGDELYWKALRRYYEEFRLRRAQPQDLLRILRQTAPDADLLPIFHQFLDYRFLDYVNLTVSIGGPEDDVWSGQVVAPMTVTADSPTYGLTVLLDGEVLTTTSRSITLTLETGSLSAGRHELVAQADDGGINMVETRRTFRVDKPTPTPMSTLTPTPSSVAEPATPSPAATASLTPTTETTPSNLAGPPVSEADRRMPLAGVAALVLVAALATAGVWLGRKRRPPL